MLSSSYIHVLLVNIRQGDQGHHVQMEGYALAVPTEHRPEGVLEGFSKYINTTHQGLATGTPGPIFISGNKSPMLGGESRLSMSASLPVASEWWPPP